MLEPNDGAAVTRWWWVRHAPVTSFPGRFYGQMDVPADCSNETLFSPVARILPEGAVWVVSPLQRTRQTAEAIGAAGLELPEPLVEPGFIEQNFGDWQGQRYQDVAASRDGAWHRFWLAPAHERPPRGESFEQLVERVREGIVRLTRAHSGQDIVAVAHGGSIRAAVAVALDLSAERALQISVANCAITRLDHIAGAAGSHEPDDVGDADGVWRVGFVNLAPRGLG